MPKLNDNQKSLLILGGGLLFAIAFGVKGYFDYETLQEVRAEITAKKETHTKNQKEIDRERELKHQVVAFGAIVAENARILPTEEDLNNFIRDLATLEKDTGVSINQLPRYTGSKDKRDPTILKVPMTLALTASTRNFLSFLNQLENRERLVTVTDVRFNPASADAKNPTGQDLEHDVTVKFDVYKYDPAGTSAKDGELVTQAETLLLRESNEVKAIIKKEGKPTFLEKYRLLRVKESRRDFFLDPRRHTGKVGAEAGVDDTRQVEVVRLEHLKILYEKAKLELESFREAARNSTDFLRRSAAKRAFITAWEALETKITEVSARSPEFTSRDIQDRYITEVKNPYQQLESDSRDVRDGQGPKGLMVTAEGARGYRSELTALMKERKFKETIEKSLAIETLLKDAGKNVEDGARPEIEAMKKIAEHAHFQSLLEQRKMNIQGIVRMIKKVEDGGTGEQTETVSAVIANGRFLKPGEYLDKDLVFRGVEADGRLLFTFVIRKGETNTVERHDVDYLQKQPDLLDQSTAILGQE